MSNSNYYYFIIIIILFLILNFNTYVYKTHYYYKKTIYNYFLFEQLNRRVFSLPWSCPLHRCASGPLIFLAFPVAEG